jgi:hypothetical protein
MVAEDPIMSISVSNVRTLNRTSSRETRWLAQLRTQRRSCLEEFNKNNMFSTGAWKIFPKQSLSFSYADTCVQQVHVFAFEDEQSIDGRRKYLVSAIKDFWEIYRDMKDEKRSFYEVIREGRCHTTEDADLKRILNEIHPAERLF